MGKDSHPLIGKRVVSRANRSGVHIGTLVGVSGSMYTLKGIQRVWSWEGALDTATLAVTGPSSAQMSPKVRIGVIEDAREVYAMTKKAGKAFRKAGVWSR